MTKDRARVAAAECATFGEAQPAPLCARPSTQKWRSLSAASHAGPSCREVLSSHKDLAHQLVALENKYDRQSKVVFDAIGKLPNQDGDCSISLARKPTFATVSFGSNPEIRPQQTFQAWWPWCQMWLWHCNQAGHYGRR